MATIADAAGGSIVEQLRVLAVPVDNLTPDPENARRGDVAAIRRSLNVFGQRKPIVAKRTGGDAQGRPTGVIIAGNHTYLAAVDLGWTEVAAVFTDDDAMTARAYALADNRTGELASWDDETLTAHLRELNVSDFDMSALGWADADLAALIDSNDAAGPDGDNNEDDADVPEPPGDPVTQPGDVWMLGQHRVVCGDCSDGDTVARLLDGARVNLAFTSPPYADRRTYDETSGFRPIPPEQYVEWFAPIAALVREHLAADGSWFVNIKEHCEDGQRLLYVKDLTIAHVRAWGWRFVDELCWVKPDPFPGGWPGRFKNAFEPILHFASAEHVKFNPDAVATASATALAYRPGRESVSGSGNVGISGPRQTHIGSARPSNVIECAVRNTENGVQHTAVFPPKLPAFFVQAYTDPGDVVYDPFMGSGSTLLAAHRHDRTAYGCEISPGYVDVICRRFQRATGIKPVRAATGEAVDFADDFADDNGEG